MITAKEAKENYVANMWEHIPCELNSTDPNANYDYLCNDFIDWAIRKTSLTGHKHVTIEVSANEKLSGIIDLSKVVFFLDENGYAVSLYPYETVADLVIEW